MAPERDADADLLADVAVVFVERLVLLVQEVQHRRVHHDVVRADRLGMAGEVEHDVEVLVGARHDGPAAADLLDRGVEQPFPFGDRHGVELALFAADKHAVDAEVGDPVAEIAAETGLVDREIGGERRLGGRPDAAEVLAGVGLGVASGVVHGGRTYLIRLAILSTIGFGVA